MDKKKNANNYDDIINLPHPTSNKHPRMSMHDRAAQFAPFAALTGHSDAIKETARLTEHQLDLDEDTIFLLDRKLHEIKDNLDGMQPITITYFVPDATKSGGKYIELTSVVKKIDEFSRLLVMEDDKVVPIEYICDIM